MAIDMTGKTLDLATQIATESGNLMVAVRRLVALKERTERGGILFAPDGVPVSFGPSEANPNGTALAYTDGNGINNALTSAAALKAWMDANFHTDNFDQVRTGTDLNRMQP